MILVTGGAGFIGSNFILDWLAQCDEPVLNLDKLTYASKLGNLQLLAGDPRHLHVQGDIADGELVASLLARYKPRAILNFAAETHVDRSIDGPRAFIATNVNGTFALLEAACAHWQGLGEHDRRAFRFLQVSTDEVYGSLGPHDAPFSETTAYAPNSPYAASKASADHLVRAWHHTYGLPTLTTNCSNNYGPCQFPEKLIPLCIANARQGKPLPIYGDGQQVRDWLYVADHCAAIRRVLEAGRCGDTYNVGANQEMANLAVVRMLCSILDECAPKPRGSYLEQIVHVADRPGHDRRYAIDARRMERELDWKPRETFASGLRKTVDWYLAHDARVRGLQAGDAPAWLGQAERATQARTAQ